MVDSIIEKSSVEQDEIALLDLAYLHQHSLGNAALETEMLELFLRQSMRLLLEFNVRTEPREWRDFARTLKSSASGIGALEVAQIAERLELCGQSKESAETRALLAALETAVLKVNDCIRHHLQKNLSLSH